jgi:hypothetical protein
VVHIQATKVVMAKTTAASALAADSGQVRSRRDFVVRGRLKVTDALKKRHCPAFLVLPQPVKKLGEAPFCGG